MLINQDFAQSEPKSPVKRRMELVSNEGPKPDATNHPSEFDRATRLLEQTITKIDGAYAPSTIRAYRADFQDLIKFCSKRNQESLPTKSELIVQYICKLVDTGRSSASIRRAIAGIATIHKLNRLEDPTKDPDALLEMRRMHRKIGRHSKQAFGVTIEMLDKLIEATEGGNLGARDRALLLIAYDTLCRRSELVDLLIEDIKHGQLSQASVLIKRSKTDQFGQGKRLLLSERSTLALKEWLMRRENPKSGRLFMGINRGQKITESFGAPQINRVYKRLARRAGFNKDLIERISGHSLRVGHAQDLVNSGESLAMIMSKGRWSKTDTVMRYAEHINYRY
jgi:site-specific recombinase XerD